MWSDPPHLQHPLASISCTETQRHCLAHAARAGIRRYPFRMLRYWFMHRLIHAESRKRGPLAVCEFGVDRGQMLYFANRAAKLDSGLERPAWLQRWDAVDVRLQTDTLKNVGYDKLVSLDLEHDPLPQELEGRYDVIILLHVLEHLHDPEPALQRLLAALKPGGIVIGGMPVLPDALVGWREKALRKRASRHGHVSAFSPQRIRDWAQRFGLRTELCSGAFFLRSKMLWLENHEWWTRFNLYFGALFPWWPGEVYWSFRKPLQS